MMCYFPEADGSEEVFVTICYLFSVAKLAMSDLKLTQPRQTARIDSASSAAYASSGPVRARYLRAREIRRSRSLVSVLSL